MHASKPAAGRQVSGHAAVDPAVFLAEIREAFPLWAVLALGDGRWIALQTIGGERIRFDAHSGSELRARLEPYRAAIPSNHRRGRPLDSSRREEAPFPQRGGPQEGCATGQWTGWPRTPGTL